ncbi:Leucine-rich repeat transmembrane protein kinase [Perilla frutescens var. hirtella]|nr:Leucine-rich repeat transmembrane protein kinase [Perilla frutescens var. hirtella]
MLCPGTATNQVREDVTGRKLLYHTQSSRGSDCRELRLKSFLEDPLNVLHDYNNSLQGNLPDELTTLANLTRINLSHNKLNGSIAPLCTSPNYLSFDVTSNTFDHDIPHQIGNSPALERLRLGGNPLDPRITPATISVRSSSLPISSPGLFNCSNLLLLSLSNNSLNGTLPPQVGQLKSLNVLDLDNNRLSGSIPPTIGQLNKLYQLRLSRNSFNGEIPVEIGQLQNLQSALDISYNNLTGGIPSSIGALAKLEELDLSHNGLAQGMEYLHHDCSSMIL